MIKMHKVEPSQISKHWHWISPSIEMALPPTISAAGRMSKVLESLMVGKMVLHTFYDHNDNKDPEILAILVTAILDTLDGDDSQLLIYSIYAFKETPLSYVKGALELIKIYAKNVGCNSIIAYTNIPSMRKFITLVGGKADFTLLRLEV